MTVNIELDELISSWDDLNNITVDGGPLVIEYEKLSLRPAMDARKSDITFDTTMLEELATEIWDEQESVGIPERD